MRKRHVQTGARVQNAVAPYPGTGQRQTVDAPRLVDHPLYPGDERRQNQDASHSRGEMKLLQWPQR